MKFTLVYSNALDHLFDELVGNTNYVVQHFPCFVGVTLPRKLLLLSKETRQWLPRRPGLTVSRYFQDSLDAVIPLHFLHLL